MENDKNFVSENPQVLDKINDKQIEIHSENLVFKYENNENGDVRLLLIPLIST